MTLRVRLVVSFTALLLAAIASFGFVLVRSSRNVLVGQLDHDLREVAARASESSEQGAVEPDGGDGDVDPFLLTGRRVAEVLVSSTGEIVTSRPSGYADRPDPLPDVSQYTMTGRPQTIGSVDGTLTYRAIGTTRLNGTAEVYAFPMGGVEAAVHALLRVLVTTGAAVLVLGAGATWAAVRTSLKPVEDMVDVAADIAQGDLGRRVPESPGSGELHRLGQALNDMLVQIESAFAGEQESKDRLRRFVADASHELRTPLAAVQGYTELYRKGALADSDSLDNAMRRIGTESARMQNLVEDLLLLARLDEHRPLESRPVDLASIVRDAVTDAKAIDPARPVHLECPDAALVSGDGRRLAQVILNLLSNVRVHTPAGTPVTVRVLPQARSVRVDVIDDGPGLEPAHLDKVFDRFFRADASRTRKTGGAGLGLSIVAAIVESHGGKVEVANEPGHGARFSVVLPAAHAREVAGALL
jgi:two-component system OmpR family sensor kinase